MEILLAFRLPVTCPVRSPFPFEPPQPLSLYGGFPCLPMFCKYIFNFAFLFSCFILNICLFFACFQYVKYNKGPFLRLLEKTRIFSLLLLFYSNICQIPPSTQPVKPSENASVFPANGRTEQSSKKEEPSQMLFLSAFPF